MTPSALPTGKGYGRGLSDNVGYGYNRPMFPLFILGIAILAGLLLAGQWFVAAEPKALVRALKWLLLGIIISVVALFALSGRLGWALASLPALLPWLFRIQAAHRIYIILRNLGRGGQGYKGTQGRAAPGPMTRERALEILGLERGAGRAEIKAAHHRLISNLHPDKGGSNYLAAEINQAKDVLLGK